MTKKPSFDNKFVKISSMKLFVFLAILHLDSLPDTSHLYAALSTFHALQLNAQLTEFDESEKGIWMNYVPSVGIGYNLQGQPRPTFSFSIAQVFTAQRQRTDRSAKRRSLEAAAQLALQNDRRKLTELLTKWELMQLELITMRKVAALDEQIFNLAQADYDAAKLAPKEFLPKQKAWLESELTLTRKEIEIKNLEAEILTFCHL